VIISSPVKRFPGTVNCPDMLTLPQVLQIENALREMAGQRETMAAAGFDYAYLKAILPLYSDWHIEGVPAEPTSETFPGSPRVDSARLIAWLIDAIMQVYRGETDIPNA
jgi:hypothetical protein